MPIDEKVKHHRELFMQSREIQWKVNIGLWTLLSAAIALGVTNRPAFPWPAWIPFGAFIAAHWMWVSAVHNSMSFDKDRWVSLLSMEERAAATKRFMGAQIIVTAVLCACAAWVLIHLPPAGGAGVAPPGTAKSGSALPSESTASALLELSWPLLLAWVAWLFRKPLGQAITQRNVVVRIGDSHVEVNGRPGDVENLKSFVSAVKGQGGASLPGAGSTGTGTSTPPAGN